MFSRNLMILVGTVTRDPSVRTVGENKKCEISIACNESFKDKAGEWKERTSYIDCIAWRRNAEYAESYIKKGDRVYIEGRFDTDSWEKDGVKHRKSYCNVEKVSNLGKIALQAEESEETQPAPQVQGTLPVDESDTPF
jgi:single-strand DNA-binding protein